MSKDNPAQGHRINIELGEEMAPGTYANATVVTHSGSEFVFDFVRVVPGVPKAKVVERIIMAAPNAKAFMKTLEQNMQKFESMHGEIAVKASQTLVPGSDLPS
ncbi:MAG: DUF3467 domain-containing protein [Candidatus Krumholzibacteria bacterium]|jgi:hypothetical protein|nr:DUF3467 domain-containing protein [Candidatus Krumholzibacteria bacterium]MDP6670069.1 DUF3467 domain-containing protein [Candidatus Krumholzibacteria bacterium]MDP6797646.1 DUF3467 domain-containing protein [Candidatus Krumholzibacteria bacterium]MDP7020762.1 DUF3467 domain-containing protein [Candidatus Krumholzibacteria bacterium]